MFERLTVIVNWGQENESLPTLTIDIKYLGLRAFFQVTELSYIVLQKCIQRATMYYEVVMMSISIRVSEKESKLIKKYAELNGTTVSEVMRQAIFSKIEDEFDIFLYEQAYKEYEENPKTYTIEEAKKLLDF